MRKRKKGREKGRRNEKKRGGKEQGKWGKVEGEKQQEGKGAQSKGKGAKECRFWSLNSSRLCSHLSICPWAKHLSKLHIFPLGNGDNNSAFQCYY